MLATFWLSSAALSCKRTEPAPSPASSAVDDRVHDSRRPLEIAVTNDGFVPARAKIKVGEPVTLAVTRKVANTCATEIVIKDFGVNKPLPENQRVEITITPKQPGTIRYACGMDMVSGELVAE
jgi:plastocyanin domain-containing protein